MLRKPRDKHTVALGEVQASVSVARRLATAGEVLLSVGGLL